MYDNVYSQVDRSKIYQTDTDSIAIQAIHCQEFMKKCPGLFGDRIGQLDLEISKQTKKVHILEPFWAVRPKVYAGKGVNGCENKMRMKGVSCKGVLIKNEEQYLDIVHDFNKK